MLKPLQSKGALLERNQAVDKGGELEWLKTALTRGKAQETI